MNKISDAFNNKKAFIPFVTAGDPDLDTTKEILFAMQEGGADLIEIGIPFSDPVAEGPVIQEADLRALEAGTTTDHIFDMVRSIKDKLHVPVVHDLHKSNLCIWNGKVCQTSQRMRSSRRHRAGCAL